ncbi:MAG TPA: 3-hydroxyacyl-ACP dehydratase FabZ [Kiritimatiellia bacterium]|jgi:beta-hydroxyacyl-ACP dehydratase FabZ|nr:3-hydroxyacyl-ACP dehydratase FabZ [Kiritimatiellia bacterium]OQC60595.1 MAG: 3-hydroxyacyl-(acyl-carrier-protein) dehydratase FabZ [Verrucomicrobia bacterium ADurb.Bin018]MBP9572488.1 3-hydroxyacyl-ACP dehydratase FabZ [Kiritimatiellia bacterium]HOE00123.1 3-hydroxyacyl-ACP dehydratase FabZ [Kiritimatiellia bacterium]HOE36436.1 3-hydroxyacyl-ACP dehydratase FabZ [Kiritimatiellia bacterium]
MNTVLEAKDILNILPHRHPFLLVDRIVECNNKDWIVGIKNVAANEPCFQGHFPGLPIFPGVLQLEAMAQTAGILLNTVVGSAGKVSYYLGVDQAKFRRMVVPGDQMRMEIKLLRLRMGMAKVAGRTLVDGELACEAEMMFGGGK